MLLQWFLFNWKHYAKNEYTFNDTQSFFQELSTFIPLEEDKKDVSYYAESLFINITVTSRVLSPPPEKLTSPPSPSPPNREHCHPKIKHSMELNPKKFLDTKVINT